MNRIKSVPIGTMYVAGLAGMDMEEKVEETYADRMKPGYSCELSPPWGRNVGGGGYDGDMKKAGAESETAEKGEY